MTTRRSAGILLFGRARDDLEVLLGHMGGPFWARRDAGAWTIPKGEHDEQETAWDAARREFVEELGLDVPAGEPVDLGEVRQSGGKVVRAFAIEGRLDPDAVVPGTFEMEWPRGSGRLQRFPELDRVAWFTLDEAADRIVKAQRELLTRLRDRR
jgi:predicted NUDIX family NTP pyrophosphohydrolase